MSPTACNDTKGAGAVSRTGWNGIFPSLCTPFLETGEPDFDGVERVADAVVAAGAHGVVCLGLAGEVDTLTVPERIDVASRVAQAVAGRVPVLVGATGPNLTASFALAEHAERLGAAGIVLPAPANLPYSDREILDHFTSVAGRVELPVVIQDAPEFIAAEVQPELVARAAEQRDNIRAVKVEVGPEDIERWRLALGDRLDLLAGSGGLYMLDALDAGAVVIMPGCDLTDQLAAVQAAWSRHDRAAAAELFTRLLPLLVWQNQEQQHSNRCVKTVLRYRGLDIPSGLRPPAERSLSPSSLTRLERYLDALSVPDLDAVAR